MYHPVNGQLLFEFHICLIKSGAAKLLLTLETQLQVVFANYTTGLIWAQIEDPFDPVPDHVGYDRVSADSPTAPRLALGGRVRLSTQPRGFWIRMTRKL